MQFDHPGSSFGAPPQPYYAPIRQQPKPLAPKPQAALSAKPQAAPPISVPAPEQFGILLEDAPVVVPTPADLGIDIE